MALRTKAIIETELINLGPSVIADPDEIAHANNEILKAIFHRLEEAVYTLHDRRYIGLADGHWLDEHGEERGIPRFPAESDADYRVRVMTVEDKVTPAAILATADAILTTGTAILTEAGYDAAWANMEVPAGISEIEQGQGFAGVFTSGQPMATTQTTDRYFTIYILDQLDPDIDLALQETVERMRAAGVGFHIEILN